MTFTHLHVHSHYSLLEAIWSPKALIAQAKALDMEAISLTDYAGMYGAVEFYKEAKKQDIKPIIGVELGYVQDMHYKDPQENAGTIVLLARNYEGYQNLMQIVSQAQLEGFHKIPRIDQQCLQNFKEGIITLSWGPNSRLGKLLIAQQATDQVNEQLVQLMELFGKKDCYLSRIVQDKPGGNIQEVNKQMLSLAETHQIDLVCSGDTHYIYANDLQTFEIALAIKDSKRIYDTDRRHADGKRHLQSEEEIRKRLKKSWLEEERIEEMIKKNNEIADSIDIQIPMGTALFPVYESPAEITELYGKRKEKLVV